MISGLRAMEGMFVGIAAVDIFIQAIEGITNSTKRGPDINNAVEEYGKRPQQEAATKLD